MIGGDGGEELVFVFRYKRVVKAVKGVDVGHHAGGPVEDAEMVAEEFLSETTNLVERAFIIKNVLDRVTVAKPVEMCAP